MFKLLSSSRNSTFSPTARTNRSLGPRPSADYDAPFSAFHPQLSASDTNNSDTYSALHLPAEHFLPTCNKLPQIQDGVLVFLYASALVKPLSISSPPPANKSKRMHSPQHHSALRAHRQRLLKRQLSRLARPPKAHPYFLRPQNNRPIQILHPRRHKVPQ